MADKDIFFVFIFLAFTKLSLGAGKECCSSVLLDSDLAVHKIQGDRLGFYTQFGYYGARPFYRQQGGDFYIFYLEDVQHWIECKNFYGAGEQFSKLVNEMNGYCLDDHNNWSFYNGSDLMYSELLTSNCSKIEDVCCQEISISSANSEVKTGNQSFYPDLLKETLGIYKSIGVNNGRYVYQHENQKSFLEYGARHYWFVTLGIGKYSGRMLNSGGSVCPEHIEKEWHVSDKNEDGEGVWKEDPELKITCVKKTKDVTQQLPQETGPVSQSYVQIEQVRQASSYSSGAVVFGCISMILLSMMMALFTRRFYRAWGRGAHGKQLLLETLDIE